MERGHAVVGKIGGAEPELDQVVEVLILRLEVLRGEEHPPGPDDARLPFHAWMSTLCCSRMRTVSPRTGSAGARTLSISRIAAKLCPPAMPAASATSLSGG